MPHRKAKRSRDAAAAQKGHAPCIRDGGKNIDFMVLLPPPKNKAEGLLKMQQVLDRLVFLGYTSVALTHRIYGKPKKSTNVDQLFEPFEQLASKKKPLRVYRRLHAVIETLSDIAFFGEQDEKSLTSSYDLVSLTPGNESIFQSACSSSMVDLITLDYSKGTLPFKVRNTNVQAAMDHQIGLEILYGPSILSVPHRKTFIQLIRSIEAASVGKSLKLVVSSGSDTDAMALRSPGDVANVLETVALMDPTRARGALSASWILDEAIQRRTKTTRISNVRFGNDESDDDVNEERSKAVKRPALELAGKNQKSPKVVAAGDDDGFITL